MQMNKRLLEALIVVSLVVLLSTLLAACGTSDPQAGGQDPSGALDGKALVEERCTQCHTLDRVTSAHKTKEEWTTTVERMVSNGANLDAEEQAAVIAYLAETYP
jgi:mono/diheme cytochrome c family protein